MHIFRFSSILKNYVRHRITDNCPLILKEFFVMYSYIPGGVYKLSICLYFSDLTIFLCIQKGVCLSVCVCPSVYLSIYLSVCLSTYLSKYYLVHLPGGLSEPSPFFCFSESPSGTDARHESS